jgi:mono/diheme cytochrome c family protein
MNKCIIYVGILWLGMISCDRTRSSTGWDYMPDMYYSRAYETYAPNPNFKDSMTMRKPVEGTVPRDMIPFDYENTTADRAAAGDELVNPLEVTPDHLDMGEEVYRIFCLSCHGEKGEGQGYLYKSQRYPYPPGNLVSEEAVGLKDGEIYHTITVGYGIMGAHGGLIRPDDRWMVILFIREELQ